MRYTELSLNTQKESMRTWRRRKETLGGLGEYAKRHKSVYISVNNNTKFNFLKILFIFTICNGLSQKTISRYCPFEAVLCKDENMSIYVYFAATFVTYPCEWRPMSAAIMASMLWTLWLLSPGF